MATQDLLTRYRADTRNFDRGTRRINDSLRRLERTTSRRMDAIDRRMKRAGRAIVGAFAGLATIRGIRQLTRSSERAVDSLDNIAKQADKLGLTTDALQELRVAAELSGVAINTFDQAWQRFTRRTAEAANGTGEARDALAELNIQLRDSEGNLRPTEVLFSEVADAIAAVEDPATRVRLAFKLFDSEGVSLVNMLQNGSAALDEMRRKARELGVVIDADLIRRSVEARDQLTLLQRVIDAELTVALVDLAPLLIDLSRFLAAVAQGAADAYQGMRLLAGTSVHAVAVPGLTEDLAAARSELAEFDRDFAQRLEDFGQNLSGDQLNAVLEREAARRQAIVDRIEALQDRLTTALGGGEDVVPEPAPVTIPTGGGGVTTSRGGSLSAEATEEREGALERELRLLAERTNEISRMTEAQARLDPEMEGYTVALRAAEVEARLLARAEAEGVEVKGDLAERIRQVAQAYAEAEFAAERLRGAQEQLDETPRIFDDMARGLEGAISQARTFEEALQNVLAVLAQIALQAALTPKSSGGLGLFGSIFSGIFSGSAAPSSSPVPIPAPRAHGGPVTAGRAYIVGEKRPELFIPGSSGTIVPSVPDMREIVVPKDVGMGRGGNNVTVEGSTIVLQGSDATPEELERVLDRRDRQLVERIIRMNDRNPDLFHT